ncbi:hypothetical protein X364_02700, partial [Mycobacterium tuberculosis XTB13-147]
MPGRFREGTETCIRKVRTLETLPTCRQTQNPERGRKLEEPSHLGLPPAGRQTQNPERGRKLNNTFFERGAVESVVRPKTPRGDGNTETQHQPDNLILASSDP